MCHATPTTTKVGDGVDRCVAGGDSAAQAAQVNTCINALNGVNILTYSGWQLAFGKDPVIGIGAGRVQPEQCGRR